MTAGPDPQRLMASDGESDSLRTALRSAKADLPGNTELRALAAALAPQVGPGGSGGVGAGGAGAKAGMGGLRWMIASGVIVGGVALVVALRAPRSSTPVEAQPQGPAEIPASVTVDTSAHAPNQAVEPPSVTPVQSAGEEPSEGVTPPDGAGTSKPRVVVVPKARSASSTESKPGAAPKPSEASLLDGARRALQSDPQQALALTDRHRELYPQGLLAQEREVIAIEALRKLGEQQAARQRSQEFDARYPTTIHGREIETEADAGKK